MTYGTSLKLASNILGIMAITAEDAIFVASNEGKICSVFMDTITIKVPSERTNGSYSICEDITPPGAGAPPHIHHREEEMFYVLEGEYDFRCGEREFKATRGALVILPREIPHAFKNTGNTPGKTLLILRPGGMEKVFGDISLMPQGPPDLEKINAITKKYGVEFLPFKT